MDKSIRNFLVFLDYVEKQLQEQVQKLIYNETEGLRFTDEEVSRRLAEVRNFRKYLVEKRYYGDNHGEIFGDFAILSEFLDASKLSMRDKHNIILFFIEKNTKSGILAADNDTVNIVDLRDLDSELKGQIGSYVRDLLKNNKFTEFVRRPIEEFTPFELEVLEYVKKFAIDLTPYRVNTAVMKKSYIDKMDGITEEDMNMISLALKGMRVSSDCIEAFLYVARKKIIKEEVAQVVEVKQAQVKEDENVITPKDFKMMKGHIKRTFDVRTGTLLRPVSYDEMLYTARLMYRLGYPESEIKSLFKAAIKPSFVEAGTVTDFLRNKEKYQFYMTDEDYANVLEYLSVAEEDQLNCGFWITEAARLIRNTTIGDYGYELSLVRSDDRIKKG